MSPPDFPVPRPSRVLVVDDTDSVRALFRKILTAEGYEVETAIDGADALKAVRVHRPDVILLDVAMPVMDGLEACRRLKKDPDTRHIPIVLVTAQSELADRIRGIEAGADEFVSKPLHPDELRARVRSLARMKQLIDAIGAAEEAFTTLALTIEARDPTTHGHCERMAYHASRLGRALGLGDEDIEALHRGGYLHDIGKVGVPDAVLLKPGPLTVDETTIVHRHTTVGDVLCAPLVSLQRVRPIVLGHHERIDGSGYPSGLKGDAVPLLAQIVGIVDVYDSLTSHRPYRRAYTVDHAVQHLAEQADIGRFASRYVQVFLETL